MPNSFYELMLNNETVSSSAIRRAIDLALDKEALCLHTAQGLGEPTATDLTPGHGLHQLPHLEPGRGGGQGAAGGGRL